MKISVIIPCYNEERAIGLLVESIPKEVSEIIVIDNNSTDSSGEVARARGAKVFVETRQGYGAAIRRGFAEATGEILVVLDADGQYPIEHIMKAVQYLKNNNIDFVSCSRFPLVDKSSLPLVRRIGNHIFTIASNLLFGTVLQDSQSGMWVFKKSVLDKIQLTSYDMPLSEEIKLRVLTNRELNFREFSIPYKVRVGESKLLPIKHGLKNLCFLFKLRVDLWKKVKEERKRFLFGVGVFAILALYFLISWQHIGDPFIHVSADVNGGNALAAQNWVKHGFWNMRFGLHYSLLRELPAPGFYTHHPNFFLLPTAIMYKLFGMSDTTTRLGPLLTMISALAIFGFGLRSLARSYLFPLLALLVFIMLPGVIFYGQTFELAVFSVPAALVTFSFFVFYYRTKLSLYRYLMYISIVVGGLLGWFYYFLPASIWLFLFFTKEGKQMHKRKEILVTIPTLLCILFALNLLHFYILNGFGVFAGLESAFLTRTHRMDIGIWFGKIWRILKLHIDPVFLVTTVLGLSLATARRKKDQFMKYSWLFVWMMLLVAGIFFQWSTHPFGAMFTWTVVALFSAYLFTRMIDYSKVAGSVAVILILIAGAYMSKQNTDYFYNTFRLMSEDDIALVKELAPYVEDGDVCIGGNDFGIGYASIFEWYMDKKILGAPDCFDKGSKIALIMNPQIGEFFVKEQELFKKHGFVMGGCRFYWCGMERKGDASVDIQ